MIIKELQVIYSKLIIAISIVLFFSCQSKNNNTNGLTQLANNTELQKVLKQELVLKPNIGLVYYNNEPFTGISYANYSNGKKAEQTSYLKGLKHGNFKKWYQDGTLSFKSLYQKGVVNGNSKSWWKDGKIRSESNHLLGKVNGVQKQWYKTGERFKELNIVNGKEEGLQKAWRRNGKLYNNYEAKNGRIFGLKRASLCFDLEDEIVQTKKI